MYSRFAFSPVTIATLLLVTTPATFAQPTSQPSDQPGQVRWQLPHDISLKLPAALQYTPLAADGLAFTRRGENWFVAVVAAAGNAPVDTSSPVVSQLLREYKESPAPEERRTSGNASVLMKRIGDKTVIGLASLALNGDRNVRLHVFAKGDSDAVLSGIAQVADGAYVSVRR